MSAPHDIDRPYPGIRPFRKSEHAIFYGRRRMIDDVLELLGKKQLVVVHGSSGCGKSSLIKAGVLPRLQQEHRLHGIAWTTAEMRPGGAPLMNLAEVCACLAEGMDEDGTPAFDTVRKVRRLLSRGPAALAPLAEMIGAEEGRNVCLLIDQFEELFRFTEEFSREESESFTAVLRGFAETPPPGLHVIVTMRSDFLGDCAQFIGFAELVNDTQYLLPRLNETQMMRAICQPARDFGGDVAPDLAVRMIAESRRMPDALPLIQHCLMYLWSEASRRPPPEDGGPHPVLDLEDFVGLNKTLSARAEAVMTRLEAETPSDVKIAEHLFRAVIAVDAQGRATRRPLRRSTLLKVTGGDQPGLERVLSAFSAHDTGFLFVSRDEDPFVDISHEALIRCWDRLNDQGFDRATRRPRGWLRREQEDERLWRALLVQAENGDIINPEALADRQSWFRQLPGPEWAERHGGGWEAVSELLKRSEDQRIFDERARRRAVRRDRRWKYTLATAAVVLSVLFGTTLYFYFQANESALAAKRNEDLAIQARNDAARRAREANQARKTAEAERRKAEVERKKAEALRATAEDRKRRTEDALVAAELARADAEDSLHALGLAIFSQWEATERVALADRKMTIPRVFRRALVAMEHLPDAAEDSHPIRPLLPQNETITLTLRNALAGKLPDGKSDRLNGDILDLAISRDGRLLAVAISGNQIQLRDAGNFRLLATVRAGHTGSAPGMAFSLDGKMLYSAYGRTIRIWDTASAAKIHEVEVGQFIRDLVPSADGRRLAIATRNGEIRVLATADWNELHAGRIPEDVVSRIALDPAGDRIASIGTGNWVTMSDLDGDPVQWAEMPTRIRRIDWSPDGRLIAGLDGTSVSIWDAQTGARLKSFEIDVSRYSDLDFSPDGRMIALIDLASRSAKVVSVDAGVTVPVLVIALNDDVVTRIAWSMVGRRLFAGSSKDRLYAVDVPARPILPEDATFGQILAHAKETLQSCFSEADRERLKLLVPDTPRWCIERRKPPYDGEGRIEYGKTLIRQGNGEMGEALIIKGVKLLLGTTKGITSADIARRSSAESASAYLAYVGDLVARGDPQAVRKALLDLRRVDPATTDETVRATLIGLVRTKGRARLRSSKSQARRLFATALEIDPGVRDAIIDELIRYLPLRNHQSAILLLLERMSTKSLPTEEQISGNELLKGFLVAPQEISAGDNDSRTLSVAATRDWSGAIAAVLENRARTIRLTVGSPDRPAIDLDLGLQVGTSRPPDHVPWRLAFNRDGTRLAATLRPYRSRDIVPAAMIWDVRTGARLFTLGAGRSNATSIGWSVDDRLIATGSAAGRVRVWNANDGKSLLALVAHRLDVRGVAFDPTSRYLVSGSDDRSVLVWDLATGNPVSGYRLHKGKIVDVAWSERSNLIASADERGRLIVWSPKTREQILRLETGTRIQAIAFSPDNSEIAIAVGRGVAVWRIADGALVRFLTIPRAQAKWVTWSADGSGFMAGGSDGKVRIWKLADTGPLRDRIFQKLNRCLFERERDELFLRSKLPDWCDQIARKE